MSFSNLLIKVKQVLNMNKKMTRIGWLKACNQLSKRHLFSKLWLNRSFTASTGIVRAEKWLYSLPGVKIQRHNQWNKKTQVLSFRELNLTQKRNYVNPVVQVILGGAFGYGIVTSRIIRYAALLIFTVVIMIDIVTLSKDIDLMKQNLLANEDQLKKQGDEIENLQTQLNRLLAEKTESDSPNS